MGVKDELRVETGDPQRAPRKAMAQERNGPVYAGLHIAANELLAASREVQPAANGNEETLQEWQGVEALPQPRG
jgi:hypothetical protein